MDNNTFTIYADGRKAKYYKVGLPLLAIFCIVVSVAGFIVKNIIMGIIMLALLILLLVLVPKFIAKKRLNFAKTI